MFFVDIAPRANACPEVMSVLSMFIQCIFNKGKFKNYVDRKRWVGSPKMSTFQSLLGRNVNLGYVVKKKKTFFNVVCESIYKKRTIRDKNNSSTGKQLKKYRTYSYYVGQVKQLEFLKLNIQ